MFLIEDAFTSIYGNVSLVAVESILLKVNLTDLSVERLQLFGIKRIKQLFNIDSG